MALIISGVVVTGRVELDRMLRNMTPALNHSILATANAAAAKPLIRAAQSKVATLSGGLKHSIGAARISVKEAGEIGTVHVGPRRKGNHKGRHGHLVEFGTVERFHKNGKSVGVMPSAPFMLPAFMETKGAILREQTKHIAIKLEAYMKRSLGKSFIK